MPAKKKGRPIVVDNSKCCGCLICIMRCSFRFEKAFNPSKAAIKIRKLINAATEFSVSLTDQCDSCGICARFCPHGALIQAKKEVA